MEKEISIYIHIPFCAQKCFYCDFTSYQEKENIIGKYVTALCDEIIRNSEILSLYTIRTIYIGGGTPSYIDSEYIKQILDTLSLFIIKEKLDEITIEVNPNSASLENLNKYKEIGINRLSIGVQSICNSTLKKIGRLHNFKDVELVIENANKVGFENISIDLMYPLPDIDLEKLKETLNYIVSKKDMGVKHVSIYNLEVHDNTKLGFLLKEGYISLADEDQEYEMHEYIDKKLKEDGYNKYEISNYALPGYESKHNLVYWNQGEYLGFGAAASSFFSGTRYQNEKKLESYIEKIENNEDIVIDKEDLDLLDLMKEYIILNLRKSEGVSYNKFKIKFKKEVKDIFNEEIEELIKNKLVIENKNELFLSKRGFEVANLVWEKFI